MHKISVAIAKQYSFVAIENLSVQNMQKNHYLAKSISDASWSKFIDLLEYKSNWYEAKLIKIDRFYPSSKTCSVCGYKLDSLPLSAIQILKVALSGMGQPIEPVEVCQETTVEAGSPNLFAIAKS